MVGRGEMPSTYRLACLYSGTFLEDRGITLDPGSVDLRYLRYRVKTGSET